MQSPLTPEQIDRLTRATRKGKPVVFKHKDGTGHWTVGVVEDEVYLRVGKYKHVIQRIKFAENAGWGENTHAYRTGYYTYDRNHKRIVWGQYTQFLTETEYRDLLSEVRKKGWNIFPGNLEQPEVAKG
jgi:hypothetical protein